MPWLARRISDQRGRKRTQVKLQSDPQFVDDETRRLVVFPNRMNAYPAFSDSSLERLAIVRGMSEPVTRPKGTIVFREGDESVGAYVLWEGRAKLSIGAENGRSMILGLVGRGTILGLPAVLLGLPHSATLETIKPTKMSFLRRDDLRRYLHADHNAAYEAAEMVSALYYSVLTEIRMLHLCDSAEQKVARFFLGIRPSFNAPGDKGELTVEVSQEEIGQMIGVARETVARIVSRLKKKRILQLKNSILVIHNNTALEEIAKLGRFPSKFRPED